MPEQPGDHTDYDHTDTDYDHDFTLLNKPLF